MILLLTLVFACLTTELSISFKVKISLFLALAAQMPQSVGYILEVFGISPEHLFFV